MRRYNPRRAKIHRSYTVEEVARLFEVHKNTVRAWLKSGLQPIDGRRPTLLLGPQLASFLHARREHKRQRCRPGELYCFRCRAPRDLGSSKGRLSADDAQLWQSYGLSARNAATRMYRRVSFRKLATAVGDLQVALPQAQQRIVEGAEPSRKL